MVGKLHEFIRHFYAVFHAVETDIHEVQIQVFVKCRFFFNHAREFQNELITVQAELVAAVEQAVQNVFGILVCKMLDELQLSRFSIPSRTFYPGRKKLLQMPLLPLR